MPDDIAGDIQEVQGSCTFEALKARGRWLEQHASNITTRTGEDGMILKALSLIPERNHWCVEFGAWDGKVSSNSYNLIAHHDYRGILIEADSENFAELQSSYDYPDRIIPINALVGYSAEDGLDSLLSQHPIPRDFDMLSVDIDGNDYHVWEACTQYRPNLVVIEYNPTMPNSLTFVQDKSPSVNHGCSAAAMTALALAKGYELIATAYCNLLFIARSTTTCSA